MMTETPIRRRTPATQNNEDNGSTQPEQQQQGEQPQQQQQQDTPFNKMVGMVLPSGKQSTGPNLQANVTNDTAITGYSHAAPLWPYGTVMDLLVYVDENEKFTDFSNATDRMVSMNLSLSDAVQKNASLYAHIYLTKHGELPSSEIGSDFVYKRKLLTRYLPKRNEKKTWSNDNNKEETDKEATESSTSNEIVSYWYQNLTINIITEERPLHLGPMPHNMREHVSMERTGIRDSTGTMPFHLPTVYLNDFWLLNEYLLPINETTKEMPLTLIVYPLSLLKFQLYTQFDEGLSKQQQLVGTKPTEIDQLKRTLLETNPWLLLFTVAVSVLHSVFDFLAFKNDIAFWKERKDDVAGLSIRTIGLNIFFQLVIMLYLLDNEETTSWIILISQFVGLAIECWKVKKALDIRYVYRVDGIIPWRVQFNSKASYTESKTKEYDAMAFRYLSWVTYPLLFGYALYSLVYNEHRGWYSYVLNTLVGFVYAFGFIAMTPQLFINYKLKSAEHLVDDLFAFWIIRMPTLHRLACLRDDVVFFVYLYQRWIYPVDHTRANEYGQVGDAEKEESRKDQ
ncbi:cleft lip and palate transmembrane protein 1-domain-containing protein [Syncephalis plumigaleata]|nr:cleft lip and palate transmembrane protein 1-domain-containing protein [Syncephalis plumigaleata]